MTFEERVVLFHADGFDDAIAKAEAEAKDYCRGLKDVGVEYLGHVGIYDLGHDDKVIGSGAEIYSLMRESKLSDDDYVKHFHWDGKERSRIIK